MSLEAKGFVKARRLRRSFVVGLGCLGLAVLIALGFFAYYDLYNEACFHKPRRDCDRFVPAERFVCEHHLPSTWLLGGCEMLGFRHMLGAGLPPDPRKSFEYLRQACVQPLKLKTAPCVLVGHGYGDAFSRPHYIVGWSRHFEGASYAPHWADDLEPVLVKAEGLCATDFEGEVFNRSLADLLEQNCSEIPQARANFDDARAHAPELIRLCSAGRADACHLAGLLLSLGVGLPRDLARGKALLKLACDGDSWLACDDLGSRGKKGSPLIALVEKGMAKTP